MTDTADAHTDDAAEFPSGPCPVTDLATDYDMFDPDYLRDPFSAWAELREQGCPIAHTERYGGSWLPTRYDDLQAMAKMVPELSSKAPLVIDMPDALVKENATGYNAASPISADPPEQGWTRRALLPHFTPKGVAKDREYTERLCHELIDGFLDKGKCDAAVDYAQQIPPRVIARKLGVDEGMVDDFIEWVRGVLELGLQEPELRAKYRDIIREFFAAEVADRRVSPRDDLITALCQTEHEGELLPDEVVIGMCNLQLVAGIDTTWSSIGSALWHFAGNEDDRRRMVAEPDLWDTAVEELLRFYAPVTMARNASEDVEYGGVTFKKGDKILMNFPGANHDPDHFDDAHEVQLDRQKNRHVAFGIGIHRCAGSNLARMEMEVALKTWFERIPEFTLSDPDAVTWAGGQVRGPRIIPVTFG
ncbi:MAG: cytochrome P450 [Actinomycetota bacterium]|nr:cytochrome P450 [Actinomycetota bacterium]MED6328851.1 cytochrome P450 [Actinomycetota bacterium]MEE2957387.1 cytochrome P450 [Actinomycetota bacterium]